MLGGQIIAVIERPSHLSLSGFVLSMLIEHKVVFPEQI